jgi:hypothetical protein
MLDAVESAYPIISAKDLTPAVFSEMMKRNRCLLVRNLISMSDVMHLRSIAELTYNTLDEGMIATRDGEAYPQNLFIEDIAFVESRKEVNDFRSFGSILLGFATMATATIVPILSRSVVRQCVESYFGSTMGLSLNSSSVRFSERSSSVRRVFHQDGNFLGGVDAETINCWIALDPCGKAAPSMEVFPQKIDELLPAGTDGAITSWEIAETVVYSRFGKDNAWIPEFQPGDAFLFDHLHVHRTHLTDMMTRDRYAMECWMFPIKERYRKELLAWLG